MIKELKIRKNVDISNKSLKEAKNNFRDKGTNYRVDKYDDPSGYVAKWEDDSDNGLGYNNRGYIGIDKEKQRFHGGSDRDNAYAISAYDRKPRKSVRDRLIKKAFDESRQPKLEQSDIFTKSASSLQVGDIIVSTEQNEWLEEGEAEVLNVKHANKEIEVSVKILEDDSIENWVLDSTSKVKAKSTKKLESKETKKEIVENFNYSSRGALADSIETFSDLINFASENNIELYDIVDYCDKTDIVFRLRRAIEDDTDDEILEQISRYKDVDFNDEFFEYDGYGNIVNITQDRFDIYKEEVLDIFEDNGGSYNESVETNKETLNENYKTYNIIGYGWNEDSEQYTDVESYEISGSLEEAKESAEKVADRLFTYYEKSYVEIILNDEVVEKISNDEIDESVEDNKSVVKKAKTPRKPVQKGKATVTSLSSGK